MILSIYSTTETTDSKAQVDLTNSFNYTTTNNDKVLEALLLFNIGRSDYSLFYQFDASRLRPVAIMMFFLLPTV
jgi:hypothetical protein